MHNLGTLESLQVKLGMNTDLRKNHVFLITYAESNLSQGINISFSTPWTANADFINIYTTWEIFAFNFKWPQNKKSPRGSPLVM